MEIRLNDILKISDKELKTTRIRLLKPDGTNDYNPIKAFNKNPKDLEGDCFWVNRNCNNKFSHLFKKGEVVLGFAPLDKKEHTWLFTSAAQVIIQKDNGGVNVIKNNVGYEYETKSEYNSLLGRIIVHYHNKTMCVNNRYAHKIIDEFKVVQILPDVFNSDIFPGYDKVNLSWEDLLRVIKKDTWKTALQNQKGVYLITDISNGKRYVGSAYGQYMILGRWQNYVQNGHGGNVELQKLKFDYIKKHFGYSILEIFKSTVDDESIRERENWWKEVLLSRNSNYGYNAN